MKISKPLRAPFSDSVASHLANQILCLWDQQDFSLRLPTLEIAMRFGDLGERESLVNVHLQLASRDPLKEIIHSLQQLGTVSGVVREEGTCQKERAFCIQRLRVNRWD